MLTCANHDGGARKELGVTQTSNGLYPAIGDYGWIYYNEIGALEKITQENQKGKSNSVLI